MTDTVIERLPKDVLSALNARARAHGKSVEDEISDALQEILRPGEITPLAPLKSRSELEEILRGVEQRLLEANGGRMPEGVVDAFIAERRIETLREEIRHFESVVEMAARK